MDKSATNIQKNQKAFRGNTNSEVISREKKS